MPHGGLRTFHQKSTCLDAINLKRFSGAIWSRSAPTKPSWPTVWSGLEVGGDRSEVRG